MAWTVHVAVDRPVMRCAGVNIKTSRPPLRQIEDRLMLARFDLVAAGTDGLAAYMAANFD